MGSFKGYGRPEQPSRRRNQKNPKRNDLPRVEFLEERRLLSTTTESGIPAPLWTPTSTNLFDVQHGPMANLGQTAHWDLQVVRRQRRAARRSLPPRIPLIEFNNGMVGIQVKSLGGDFSASLRASSQNVGMDITTSSSLYGVAVGCAPVNELPTIAEMQQTMAGQPLYTPIYHYSGCSQQRGGGVDVRGRRSDRVQRRRHRGDRWRDLGQRESVQRRACPRRTARRLEPRPLRSTCWRTDRQAVRMKAARCWRTSTTSLRERASPSIQRQGGDLAMSQAIAALANTAEGEHHRRRRFVRRRAVVPGRLDLAVDQHGDGAGSDATSVPRATRPTADTSPTSGGRTGRSPNIGTGTFENFNPNGGTMLTLPITTTQGNIPLVLQFDQPYQTCRSPQAIPTSILPRSTSTSSIAPATWLHRAPPTT